MSWGLPVAFTLAFHGVLPLVENVAVEGVIVSCAWGGRKSIGSKGEVLARVNEGTLWL